MSHAAACAPPSPAARLGSLPADLAANHVLFAPLFQHREQVANARRYLRGLLSDELRKSVERGPKVSGPRSQCGSWAEVGATLRGLTRGRGA